MGSFYQGERGKWLFRVVLCYSPCHATIQEVLRECGEDEAEEEESSQSMVTETAINTSCFEDESTLLAEDEESKDNVTISVKSVELRSRGMAEEEEEENQDSGGEEADSENIDPTSRRPRTIAGLVIRFYCSHNGVHVQVSCRRGQQRVERLLISARSCRPSPLCSTAV